VRYTWTTPYSCEVASRLLLTRGNTFNHSPEATTWPQCERWVESGKLNADSLTTMLVRKADMHDYEA